MSDDNVIHFEDTFDRPPNAARTVAKWLNDAGMPAEWKPGKLHHLGAADPPSVRCLACGHVVTLQPGESIPYGDPRLCEHAGQKP